MQTEKIFYASKKEPDNPKRKFKKNKNKKDKPVKSGVYVLNSLNNELSNAVNVLDDKEEGEEEESSDQKQDRKKKIAYEWSKPALFQSPFMKQPAQKPTETIPYPPNNWNAEDKNIFDLSPDNVPPEWNPYVYDTRNPIEKDRKQKEKSKQKKAKKAKRDRVTEMPMKHHDYGSDADSRDHKSDDDNIRHEKRSKNDDEGHRRGRHEKSRHRGQHPQEMDPDDPRETWAYSYNPNIQLRGDYVRQGVDPYRQGLGYYQPPSPSMMGFPLGYHRKDKKHGKLVCIMIFNSVLLTFALAMVAAALYFIITLFAGNPALLAQFRNGVSDNVHSVVPEPEPEITSTTRMAEVTTLPTTTTTAEVTKPHYATNGKKVYFSGRIKLKAMTFSDDLADRTSILYQLVAKEVCDSITKIMARSKIHRAYVNCRIISFRSGSVVANFGLQFYEDLLIMKQIAVIYSHLHLTVLGVLKTSIRGLDSNSFLKRYDCDWAAIFIKKSSLSALAPPIHQPTGNPVRVEPLFNDSFCGDKKQGFYPHPNTCNRFMQCLNNTLKEFHCVPSDYVFNSRINNCVPPELYECPLNPTSPNFCDPRPNGLYARQGECNKFIRCADTRRIDLSCPSRDFVFDPNTKKCVHKS
ncbi:unnamed protein product, partial [Owenia fusiformis]